MNWPFHSRVGRPGGWPRLALGVLVAAVVCCLQANGWADAPRRVTVATLTLAPQAQDGTRVSRLDATALAMIGEAASDCRDLSDMATELGAEETAYFAGVLESELPASLQGPVAQLSSGGAEVVEAADGRLRIVKLCPLDVAELEEGGHGTAVLTATTDDPAASLPATTNRHADTRLRPGDVVKLRLPGEPQFDQAFSIDRDGLLTLPEVGTVRLANVVFEDAEERVRVALSRAFKNLQRFRLEIVERRLLLTVQGFVAQPGQVDLPAGANVQTALAAAGGVTEGAQLNRMQLRQNGKTQVFDYKKYLDSGDASQLPQLRTMSEIFVPASPLLGNVQRDLSTHELRNDASQTSSIRVLGAVREPGSYPYRAAATVIDMLMYAGGVTATAGVEEIRVTGVGLPRNFDLNRYLESGDLDLLPDLGPGATVYVPNRTETLGGGGRSVYIMGEVKAPGLYPLNNTQGFLDILTAAQGPTENADMRKVRVTHRGEETTKVTTLDLGLFFRTGDETLLPRIMPGDVIFVPGRNAEWLEEPKENTVRLLGAVGRPGRYRFDDSMTILDLLAEAGGPTDNAWVSKIVVVNYSCCKDKAQAFDLEAFAKSGDFSQLPLVRAGDTVYVPHLGQSEWAIFMDGVRDIASMLTIVAILAAI